MSKKILLVTGKLAEGSVRKYSAESSLDVEVKVMPVPIATFLSHELLIKELKDLDMSSFSMLLVPGLARCDLKKVEDKLGLPTFKGPKYAADIPLVLGNLEKIKFSKEKPACEILKLEMAASVERELKEFEMIASRPLPEPNFFVGKGKSAVAVGKDFPLRIIAEIPDAPFLSDEEIVKIARWYLQSGAEIIDVGMVAWKKMPDEIPRVISAIKDKFDVPVSIDTLDAEEIQVALDNDIDLVLSMHSGIIDSFSGLDVPTVLVPTDSECGSYSEPSERVKRLVDLVKRAEELRYKHVIADPILEPVNMGFLQSLVAFYEFRKLEPDLPILMGVGNVIELYDADSVGMAALLVGAASEVDASLMLTVEASDKTRGNVAELRRAREMMTIAKLRSTVPKDLGIDLLRFKEKRRYSDIYDRKIGEGLEVVKASPAAECKLDAERVFKIFVEGSDIIAVLVTREGPKVVIKGKTADEICHEVIERGLITETKHAAYLGRELQKAEIALKTGRGYLQDKELFDYTI